MGGGGRGKKKAAGPDGIPNEAWIYGGENPSNKLVCVIGKVWDGEGIPEDWRSSTVIPLYKKGDVLDTKNYRGISLLLLSTAYKIYTEAIRNRLVKRWRRKVFCRRDKQDLGKGGRRWTTYTY